jgi:hypothetical protein
MLQLMNKLATILCLMGVGCGGAELQQVDNPPPQLSPSLKTQLSNSDDAGPEAGHPTVVDPPQTSKPDGQDAGPPQDAIVCDNLGQSCTLDNSNSQVDIFKCPSDRTMGTCTLLPFKDACWIYFQCEKPGQPDSSPPEASPPVTAPTCVKLVDCCSEVERINQTQGNACVSTSNANNESACQMAFSTLLTTYPQLASLCY